jgi:hypothetical protein
MFIDWSLVMQLKYLTDSIWDIGGNGIAEDFTMGERHTINTYLRNWFLGVNNKHYILPQDVVDSLNLWDWQQVLPTTY